MPDHHRHRIRIFVQNRINLAEFFIGIKPKTKLFQFYNHPLSDLLHNIKPRIVFLFVRRHIAQSAYHNQ